MKVRQDMHIHTQLSSCSKDPAQTPAEIIKLAKKNGIKTICFTDHFWDKTVPGASDWYKPQNFEHINSIRKQIPEDTSGVRVLIGCETEFTGDNVGISPKIADKMDFINLPFDHFHMKGFVCPAFIKTAEQAADLWLTRFDKALKLDLPWQKIAFAHINHILGFQEETEEIFKILLNKKREYLTRLFKRCAKQGAKIEINTSVCYTTSWDNLFDYHKTLFGIAKDCGCMFTFGSDAHKREDLSHILVASSVANQLQLEESDIYNP